MFKITLIAALLVSSAAVAQEQTNSDREAIKREQRIQALNKMPPSVFNICRGC